MKNNIKTKCNNQKIHILVGVISRDNLMLQRLLKSMSIINHQKIQLDFCIFINNHHHIKPSHNLNNANINYIALDKNQPFLEIANARNFLQKNIVKYCAKTKITPFIWLLDEDTEIDNNANNYLLKLPHFKKQGFDVLVGAIRGDSPNAAFSGMQLQLFDLLENLKWLYSLNKNDVLPNRTKSNQTLRKKYPDYYYDLTSKHNQHLNHNFWLEPTNPNETVNQAIQRIYNHLDDILSGKNIFRALVVEKKEDIHETLLRGPNTFILNIETLKIKNPVIKIDNTIIRRSDMLWALINKEFCFKKIVKVDFTVMHHRQIAIQQELNIKKTIQENYGSIVFNTLRIFFENKKNIDFKMVLQEQIDTKVLSIENSIKKIKRYVADLEKLNHLELISFCQTLRKFYTLENEKSIIQAVKQLSNHQNEILTQFEIYKPTIKNYCHLENIHGIFKQYDLGNDNIKLFSKTPIENMDKNKPPLVRIHDACSNSEVFNATDCDCASQLDQSFKTINNKGNGIIFYINQEGRGHGYSKKIAIVHKMQIEKIDTYESCRRLGLENDVRDYQEIAKLLKEFGFYKIKLLSNNPKKQNDLRQYGIESVSEKVKGEYTQKNINYLISKQEKAKHKNLVITQERLNQLYPSSKNTISFYQKEDDYGEFSNFSDYPFSLNNKYWRTSEHYYQAQKFEQYSKLYEQIQTAKTPTLAKKIAQENEDKINKNWSQQKIPFMYNAIKEKFTQNSELKKILLSTKDKYIIEKAIDDDFWGNGSNDKGQNMLGKVLMYVRDNFTNMEKI